MDALSGFGPVVLLGCGKMGSALLSRWIDAGLPPGNTWVLDPHPADWLTACEGLHLNDGLPGRAALAVVAVKPQVLPEALPVLAPLAGGETLFLSVVAGVPHATYRDILGDAVPVIRTVPNTPASIGRGITAMHGNARVTETQMATGEALLSAVGKVVRLTREDQLRLVTAVAGCGPAYVFHLIEAMTEAVVGEGLPREIAAMLAVETVAGAGALAAISDRSCAQLREDVTSPNGVTQAALKVLMDDETGFPILLRRAVQAALRRDDELGQG